MSDAHAIGRSAAGSGRPADWNWAWEKYKSTILELSHSRNLRRHLEIGGGRDPLLQPGEIDEFGLAVALNDISARELRLAPDGYAKIECDIASPSAPAILGRDAYDLAYCRVEHVPDVPAMWRNLRAVLAPGGVALSFYPTLYAPPFALNYLMPERLSRWLLEAVFPERRDNGDNPKFPAYYNYCFSVENKILPMLRAAGSTDVVIIPFWGYSYFWKFPGIRQLDAAFTALAQRRQWRIVSSFAYIVATK